MIFNAPLIWNTLIQDRNNPVPPDPEWSELHTHSKDGTAIFGRFLRARGECRGTLVFVHGFTMNGGKPWYLDWAYRIRDTTSLNVILPDLRHHGLSGNTPPSFGTAESWDISACLDFADANHLARPFYVIGESLGGMAAQRAVVEDRRIAAAMCIHTPGWPWDAVGKATAWTVESLAETITIPFAKPIFQWVAGKGSVAGQMINAHYGFDILSDGDVRNHQLPSQRPFLLYLIGEEDRYEMEKSHEIWDYFYRGEHAQFQKAPTAAPEQRKWFISVPGYGHHPMRTVFEWDGFWPLLLEFLRVCRSCASQERKSLI